MVELVHGSRRAGAGRQHAGAGAGDEQEIGAGEVGRDQTGGRERLGAPFLVRGREERAVGGALGRK